MSDNTLWPIIYRYRTLFPPGCDMENMVSIVVYDDGVV